MLLTRFSRAWICCRRMCTAHINLNILQQNWSSKWMKIQGKTHLSRGRRVNPDPCVWAQALALISFKKVRVAAEYLTAPCSKVACLKAGAMLLKRESPAKGPVPQPSKQVELPLPSGRRETSISYSLHKTLPLIYEQRSTSLTAILMGKPNTSLSF